MRLSQYTNVVRRFDYYIMHNTLHNSFLTLDTKELQEQFDEIEGIFKYDPENPLHQMLNDKKMIVSKNDVSEVSLAKFYTDKKHSTMKLFIIVNDKDNRSIDTLMLENIYHFIISEVFKNHLFGLEITIGGYNPLLKMEILTPFIEKVHQFCEENELNFIGSFKIPPVLLNVQTLVELNQHNIEHFHICFDDAFILKEKKYHDQWDKSIDLIINSDLKFECTLDVDFTNIEKTNIEGCIESLAKVFKNDERFQFYFEVAGHTENESYKAMELIYRTAKALHMNIEKELKRMIHVGGMHCDSTNDYFFAIDYRGELFKCHESLSNSAGMLSDKGYEMDINKTSAFTYSKLKQSCTTCGIYPVCSGKRCPLRSLNNDMCKHVLEHYYNCLIYLYL